MFFIGEIIQAWGEIIRKSIHLSMRYLDNIQWRLASDLFSRLIIIKHFNWSEQTNKQERNRTNTQDQKQNNQVRTKIAGPIIPQQENVRLFFEGSTPVWFYLHLKCFSSCQNAAILLRNSAIITKSLSTLATP